MFTKSIVDWDGHSWPRSSDRLERHQGGTPGGVIVRVLQRVLALAAGIWHNEHTGQPVMRSLTAYDH